MKKADPSHRVRVIERNKADDTFGFGVVFSDATLGNLAAADPDTYAKIRESFAHWDDIDTHIGGRVFTSTGHGFCGMGRQRLLTILQERCAELGVEMEFEREVNDLSELGEVDLILAADGVGSAIRNRYEAEFEADVSMRPNKFVWLGTSFPFKAFTFYFNENEHGLFRVHAYRYQEEGSTFIVECTEDTWKRAGLDETSEDETIAYLEKVFENELDGHRLVKNRSIWRNFPNIHCGTWHHDNIVLVGDAVHTAHFSIGSGTKLAMEDCIALADAVGREPDIPKALALYERERRPQVEKLRTAAQVSLEWFENTERYMGLEPIQFTYSLLTRSLRVTHSNLALRDPDIVAEMERWFSGGADPALPPMRTPIEIRGCALPTRVIATIDGPTVDDARLVESAERVGLLMTRADIADERDWRPFADWFHGKWGGAKIGLSINVPADAETDGVVDAVVAAGRRAVEAGFDVIQLELAAGNLFHHQLSALSNKAPIDQRGAVALDAVGALREALGDGVPLFVRLSARDWANGGSTAGDSVVVSALLVGRGADLVSVTTGEHPADVQPEARRLYQTTFSDRIRNELGVRTAAEGRIDSDDDINSVLAAGRADLCVVPLVPE
jgi:anthraniloyl-CoA monooxygenase